MSPENVMKLAEVMRVTKVTVYNALAFRSESESANVIRKLAMSDYGGIETTKIIM